jgi:hypothetical protein
MGFSEIPGAAQWRVHREYASFFLLTCNIMPLKKSLLMVSRGKKTETHLHLHKI